MSLLMLLSKNENSIENLNVYFSVDDNFMVLAGFTAIKLNFRVE